jgi:tRNA A37 methylthiotransferase MiaB
MLDMLLLTIPYDDLVSPPTAPAVLKGIAESHGYKIKAWDTNIDLKNHFCDGDRFDYLSTSTYFTNTSEPTERIEKFYQWVVDFIGRQEFRYLGISVFTLLSHKATFELIPRILKKYPDIKIVLGGKGLSTSPHVSISHKISSIDKISNFDKLIKKNFPQVMQIVGEGEDAIIDLFSGNHSEISEEWNVAKNDKLIYPFSNFDDYRFYDYSGESETGIIQLPVISSKGCVRSCDFCDVGVIFKKFQSKSGTLLAEEMIYLGNKYNIYRFSMTDSIANGNMKSLREMVDKLSKYNDAVSNEKKIQWAANWISRPYGSIKEEFYDALAKSGCSSLVIGAESGSNYVLEKMNKKTNVEGLYFDAEQFNRVGIQFSINNITAHWSERYEDFLQSLDMFIKFGPYFANKTMTSLSVGTGFSVLKGTPADVEFERNGIHTNDENFSLLWWSEKNPALTIKAKLARLLVVYSLVTNYNIPSNYIFVKLTQLLEELKVDDEKVKKFVDEFNRLENIEYCKSIDLVDDPYKFVCNRTIEIYPESTIEIDLVGNACNGSPIFTVSVGDDILFNQEVLGRQSLKLTYKNSLDTRKLKFCMSGKNDLFDTILDDNNNIIEDKNIKFFSIKIDGQDVYNDLHFWFNQTSHYQNDILLPIGTDGLYKNGSIEFELNHVFWVCYLQKCKPVEYLMCKDNTSNAEILEKIDELKAYIKTIT